MKAFATLTLGATAFVGAYATGALAEDAKDAEYRESNRSFVITDDLFSGDGEQSFSSIVDDVTSKDSANLTAPPPPATTPAAPRATSTVRMVVETPSPDAPDQPGVCVFVPAGDEAGGALSCPGGNVRVFEFGPGHGRQFVFGNEVVDGEEFRALVEERIAEVNERLAESGTWDIQVWDGFNGEEFQRQMNDLAREMDRMQRTMQFEFQGGMAGMSPEERAEYEEEMADLRAEYEEDMMDLRAEMAELQAEAMAEAAAAMADLHHEGVPTAPSVPSAFLNWREEERHINRDRQVIRVERDGEEHITIIENSQDEDGNLRVTIRTTDPDSIDVVRIDADEYNEDQD